MAWEAGRIACSRRMRLAQTVLRLRLLPQDPLRVDAEPDWLADLLAPGAKPPDQAVADVQLF